MQQDQATAKSIADQLSASGTYAVFKDGGDEQDDVLKVQGIALGKVEDKHGKAIKFLRVDPSVFNIVVVDISDIVIGAADLGDCMLATYGDPEVPVEYRREVFGLFQDVDLGAHRVQAEDDGRVRIAASLSLVALAPSAAWPYRRSCRSSKV